MADTLDHSFTTIHDVIIIGAGPCGLAVAARLRESTPSALFTDDEHSRYHWIRKHSEKVAIKNRKHGKIRKPNHPCAHYSMLVLDNSGEHWMTRWNNFFKTFHITHLRSPMFFHPDPQNRDGLLAYVYAECREKELYELKGCVGKEISKHKKKKQANHSCRKKSPLEINERERNDYYTPSREVFEDFCDCIVDRYGLKQNLIRKETVQNIVYDTAPELDTTRKIFAVHTDQGVRFARAVVLAVGPGNMPRIPEGLTPTDAKGTCHAMHIKSFPDPSVKEKMDMGIETNILVVGGGLTSAQVADMAVLSGSKVWHVMRDRMKIKHFDVDLEWVGKFQNFEKAAFWSTDCFEERLEQIKSARGGGSITPRYAKLMKEHVARNQLSILTHTMVKSMEFLAESKKWDVKLEPDVCIPPFDYVYFATGVQTDFQKLPFLRRMQEMYPVDSYGGLPKLTDDMMWKADVPLFVTGRLASLSLGPWAANLEGARVSAERIAWALDDVFGNRAKDVKEASFNDEDPEYLYASGIGSRFASLSID